MHVRTTVKACCTQIISQTRHSVVTLGTLPYYRFFHQNTLSPILHIAKCAQQGHSNTDLVRIITNWRERKLYELHFIQVASTILAAAVIGCFSWPTVPGQYWEGPAFWYCALVLSVTAILLSSSQAFIFNALNAPSAGLNSSGDFRRYLALIIASPKCGPSLHSEDIRTEPFQECRPRWKMVFTWQAPMMLMAYAVMFFLAGLTTYVCTPLFRGEISTDGAKISIFYLTIAGVTFATFVYCSFWAYRFIDLDQVAEIGAPIELSQQSWPSSPEPAGTRVNILSQC